MDVAFLPVILGHAGIRTCLARDGREALEVLQGQGDQVRLVLMDLAMPNMDGAEACREMRRRGMQVPVLLTSGFAERDVLPQLQGLLLHGFIQKPFQIESLIQRVNQFVPS